MPSAVRLHVLHVCEGEYPGAEPPERSSGSWAGRCWSSSQGGFSLCPARVSDCGAGSAQRCETIRNHPVHASVSSSTHALHSLSEIVLLMTGVPGGPGSACPAGAAGWWPRHSEPPSHGNAAPRRCSSASSLHSDGIHSNTHQTSSVSVTWYRYSSLMRRTVADFKIMQYWTEVNQGLNIK